MELAGTILTILTPMVAVPLSVITFYLGSLREHQVSRHTELVRRVEVAESTLRDLRKMLAEFERDYTTKEEWLRECMLARRTLQQLSEAAVRWETTVQNLGRCSPPPPRPPREQESTVRPAHAAADRRQDPCEKDTH